MSQRIRITYSICALAARIIRKWAAALRDHLGEVADSTAADDL